MVGWFDGDLVVTGEEVELFRLWLVAVVNVYVVESCPKFGARVKETDRAIGVGVEPFCELEP